MTSDVPSDPPEPLPPPWVVAPQWPPGSPGGRMGGEHYWWQFREMYLSLDAAGRAAYEQRYPPTPEWQSLYSDLRESDRSEKVRREQRAEPRTPEKPVTLPDPAVSGLRAVLLWLARAGQTSGSR